MKKILSFSFFFLLFFIFVQRGIAETSFNFTAAGATCCDGTMCTNNCNNCTLCNQYNCLISNNCFCPSQGIPHNIPLQEAPQFVFFTFDDAVIENTTYSSLWIINALTNSNPPILDTVGCTLKPTFYVMNLDSDFSLIAYYEKIGTLGVHSTTHTTDYMSITKKWQNELITDWADIKELAQVNNIYGSRCPYLECNDGYYQTLQQLGIVFDSSSSYYPINNNPGASPSVQRNWWPFTLDFGFPNDINMEYSAAGVITQPYPGLWEVPMTGYQYTTNGVFSNKSTSVVYDIMDYDIFTNSTQAMIDFKLNFNYNYNANRAPLGYYFHTSAFLDENGNELPSAITFYQQFFEWVVSTHTNVIFATEDKVIDWIKNSTSTTTFAQTQSMSMFNCPNPSYNEYNSCNNGPRTLCYKDDGTTYSICGNICPNVATKPNINWVWEYSDGSARTYLNNPAYFDTPYGGSINNTNYPNFTGTQVSFFLVNGSSNNGVNGFLAKSIACFEVDFNNPSNSYGVNGFVLTMNWCTKDAQLWTWNFPEYNNNLYAFTNGSYSGFRLIGNNQTGYMRNQPYFLGDLCLEVNANSSSKLNVFNVNNINFGIDTYREVLFCDVNPNHPNACKVFCGDGVCEKGETRSNCPIDCAAKSC